MINTSAIHVIGNSEKSLIEIELGPHEANELAERARYTDQRTYSNATVRQLTGLMEAGRWVPLSLLTIARHEHRLYLVDGQHRLKAQSEVKNRDSVIRWGVRILDDNPSRLYAMLDTVAAARSHAVRMKSLGVELDGRMLQVCNNAAAFILSHDGLQTPKRGPVLITERDEFVLTHQHMFRLADETIRQIDGAYHRHLYNPPAVAVIVATIQSKTEAACRFWPELFKAGTGPLRGMANAIILDRPEKAPTTYHARMLAHAWNHEMSGGEDPVQHELGGRGADTVVRETTLELDGWVRRDRVTQNHKTPDGRRTAELPETIRCSREASAPRGPTAPGTARMSTACQEPSWIWTTDRRGRQEQRAPSTRRDQRSST